jgi:hypothetical protein
VWPVPLDSVGGTGSGFYREAADSSTSQWSVYDIDADGLPDLVQTADPAGYYDVFGLNSGFEWWHVWRNNGAGFDTAPARWSVPLDSVAGTGSGFYRRAADSSTSQWSVYDIDGDGLRDLVQTADPAGYYDVFGLNSGSEWWCVYASSMER